MGGRARLDDECQDPFPLKALETGLSVPIFLLQSKQKGFPLLSLPQYNDQLKKLSYPIKKFSFTSPPSNIHLPKTMV